MRRRLSVLLAAFLAPLLAALGFTLWNDSEAGADEVTQMFACFSPLTNTVFDLPAASVGRGFAEYGRARRHDDL